MTGDLGMWSVTHSYTPHLHIHTYIHTAKGYMYLSHNFFCRGLRVRVFWGVLSPLSDECLKSAVVMEENMTASLTSKFVAVPVKTMSGMYCIFLFSISTFSFQ